MMTRCRAPRLAGKARHARRHRGLILVIVLMAMVFAGTLLALVSSSLAQQGKFARLQQERAIVTQLADSARAWAERHPDAFTSATGVKLDAGPMLPDGASGSLELKPTTALDGRRVLRVEVTFTLDRRTTHRTIEFPAGL